MHDYSKSNSKMVLSLSLIDVVTIVMEICGQPISAATDVIKEHFAYLKENSS